MVPDAIISDCREHGPLSLPEYVWLLDFIQQGGLQDRIADYFSPVTLLQLAQTMIRRAQA